MLYGEHDPAPDGGSIDHLFTLLDGLQNIFSSFFWRDRKWSWSLRGFEHFRLQESRLNCQHVHTVACEPVAQGFEVRCQTRFRRIVAGVTDTSSVASDRSNADNLS